MSDAMRRRVVLVTGAAGEIGQALIEHYLADGRSNLLTIDLYPLPAKLNGLTTHVIGDILDQKLFARLVTEYDFDIIYHLAALLSTPQRICSRTSAPGECERDAEPLAAGGRPDAAPR